MFILHGILLCSGIQVESTTIYSMDSILFHMDSTLCHMDSTLCHMDSILFHMDSTLFHMDSIIFHMDFTHFHIDSQVMFKYIFWGHQTNFAFCSVHWIKSHD